MMLKLHLEAVRLEVLRARGMNTYQRYLPSETVGTLPTLGILPKVVSTGQKVQPS
jgi:hypothetical protein